MPLAVDMCEGAYWFINDDDVLFGDMYYENMIRVVNDGFLCGRVGRVLDSDRDNAEEGHEMDHVPSNPVLFAEDLVCDYVGQVWAGRIEWLRAAWRHPPSSIETSEDFWISAVLKTKYGISSKVPMCPRPVNGYNFNTEMCACSLKASRKHEKARVSGTTVKNKVRPIVINNIITDYNYKVLKRESFDLYQKFRKGYDVSPYEIVNKTEWNQRCWHWV